MTSITGRIKAEPNETRPTAAGDILLYKYVESERVPDKVRKRARQFADRQARALALGHVRIRWMRHVGTDTPPEPGMVPSLILTPEGQESPSDFYGIATEAGELRLGLTPPDQPSTIVLLHSLRGPILEAVIAHEVRHLRQNRDGMTGPQREADADAYAAGQFARSA